MSRRMCWWGDGEQESQHDMTARIIYQLTTEDLQTVAQDEIGRALTEQEIEQIQTVIAEKINWFDAIVMSINETVTSAENQETA